MPYSSLDGQKGVEWTHEMKPLLTRNEPEVDGGRALLGGLETADPGENEKKSGQNEQHAAKLGSSEEPDGHGKRDRSTKRPSKRASESRERDAKKGRGGRNMGQTLE